MAQQELIAVKCPGCGQLYRLPPPAPQQRAKCRGCGYEFVIATAIVDNPTSTTRRRVSKHQGEGERVIGAALACNLAKVRTREQPWKTLLQAVAQRRLRVVAVALLLIGLALTIALLPRVSAEKPASAEVQRPPQSLGSLPPNPEKPAPVEVQRPRVGRLATLGPARTDSPFATLSELISAVEPAIVQIETRTGVGSGFVLDPAGLIVTCYHCVVKANSARVVFADSKVFEVVGVRAVSPGSDLVILEVAVEQPLPSLALSQTLPSKGEPIVTFGSPAGLSFTFGEGSITAHRHISEVVQSAKKSRRSQLLSLSPHCALLQFTATSVPGNSGGPVVDWHGNVLGVASFVLGYHGRRFDFAIAASEVRHLAKRLNEKAIPLGEMWPEVDPKVPDFELGGSD